MWPTMVTGPHLYSPCLGSLACFTLDVGIQPAKTTQTGFRILSYWCWLTRLQPHMSIIFWLLPHVNLHLILRAKIRQCWNFDTLLSCASPITHCTNHHSLSVLPKPSPARSGKKPSGFCVESTPPYQSLPMHTGFSKLPANTDNPNIRHQKAVMS